MGARIEGWRLDVVLVPFIECDSQEESERLLDYLLQSFARPIVKEIVNRKLGVFSPVSNETRQDVEDVCSDANLRLVIKLNELKSSNGQGAIADFKAYVAVTAYNTVHEYLRRRFPRRHSLKNKLRYLMSHDARFDLWLEKNGEWGCGFAKWRLSANRRPASGLIGLDVLEKLEIPTGKSGSRPADLVASIFEAAGSAVELDSLVTYVGKLWNVRDDRVDANPEGDSNGREGILGRTATVDSRSKSDDKLFLMQVWIEIKELPVRQRLALLLNLRDREGRDSIGLFPATGVASIGEIAGVLGMDPVHLAEIWNDLPMEDGRIADMLGMTRQQVINLRNAARRRLGRRLTDK